MAVGTSEKHGLTAAHVRLRTLDAKTIAAVTLLTVMGLLWARVLLRGKTPAGAEAAEVTATQTAVATQAAAAARIVPSPLPITPGRNDVLTRDFFSPENWQGLTRTQNTAANAVDPDAGDRKRLAFMAALEKTLTLEAIIQASADSPARVCIEGKVLASGQYLSVKNGSETYELAVSEIGDEQVVLTCDRQHIVLKLPPPERVD